MQASDVKNTVYYSSYDPYNKIYLWCIFKYISEYKKYLNLSLIKILK